MCFDRPLTPAQQSDKEHEYVQPQYIVDSINNLFLLPTRPYKPGTPAPPHLSPFVDNAEEGYIPDRQREINALAGIETQGTMIGMNGEDESEEDSDGEDSVGNEKERRAAVGRGDLDSSSEEESEDSSQEEEEPEKPVAKKNTRANAKD